MLDLGGELNLPTFKLLHSRIVADEAFEEVFGRLTKMMVVYIDVLNSVALGTISIK